MAEFITELDNILETQHDITRPGHVVMTLGPLVFEMGSTLCEGHTETRVSLQLYTKNCYMFISGK